MGLDQNAYKVRAFTTDGQPIQFAKVGFEDAITDDNTGDPQPGVEFGQEEWYWRKHHDLQGWMERLYRDSGGTEESFNCVGVMLSLEDIARLREDTASDSLPPTSGFFFGSGNTEHYKPQTLKFCDKAEAAIKDGWSVYYSSWW